MRALYVEELDRTVWIRPGTSDEGGVEALRKRYHVPPNDMPTPRTVLDLGANIGLTAAHYACMWPEASVWIVEPNPDNWKLARKNAPECDALLKAVGSETGLSYLREEGLSADAYTLGDQGRRVQVCALSDLVEMVGGVDFCKMDIEGTEWEILDQLDGIKYLLVEFHGEPRDYPAILARGIDALRAIGRHARHHPPHPAAVFACP